MYIFWISLLVRRDIYRCIMSIFYVLYLYMHTFNTGVFRWFTVISPSIKSLHPRVFVCFVFLLFFFSRDNQRKESSWKSEKEWKGNVSWHQPAVFNHWTNRRTPPAVLGEYWHLWKKTGSSETIAFKTLYLRIGLPWFVHEKKIKHRAKKQVVAISLPSTNMTIFQEEIP